MSTYLYLATVLNKQTQSVRNMGNFNLFQTHVLTFFHHVKQCCYPSFLIAPHIPAMTSHIAYVIYATITLITTQGLCNITFFLCLSFSLCIWDHILTMTLIFTFSLISMISYSCQGLSTLDTIGAEAAAG